MWNKQKIIHYKLQPKENNDKINILSHIKYEKIFIILYMYEFLIL